MALVIGMRMRWIAGTIVVATILAFVAAKSAHAIRDRDKMATITRKMKTVCVGRFLIDLPAGAVFSVKRGFVSGFDFESSGREDDVGFDTRMAQFEAELHAPPPKHGRRRIEVQQVLESGQRRGKTYVYDRHPAWTIDDHHQIIDIEDVSALGMLRHGRVSVTEELIRRVRELNFTKGYLFNWESAGKQNDIHAPMLTLELESGTNPVTGGKPVESSLSEGALFLLWESIVRSIRLRPTTPQNGVDNPNGARAQLHRPDSSDRHRAAGGASASMGNSS